GNVAFLLNLDAFHLRKDVEIPLFLSRMRPICQKSAGFESCPRPEPSPQHPGKLLNLKLNNWRLS
ncbi:hypothetical protein, partial [Aeromonas lacus]|uniref:hypothetical protein n=1 Tax=Aeromonas lacus TaxID=558884 RepID=UPI001EE74878